ncbi:lysophospholipid acyltransferase family protein [Dissulfurispira sp.]|uniref:lysophospholipid acyltransferase family protein n=1 Tax=Dissulfurispira sp. TaxID=2817609 RepID=UPI002FD95C8B
MKIRWLLETALIIMFSFPVAVLPHKIALKVGEILGLSVFYIWGSRRRIAVENIEKAMGNSLQPLAISNQPLAVSIARETFKNLGRSFAEIIKIYCGLGKSIIDNVEVRGVAHYMKAKSKDKGVIFITGHCGNWELMALAFGVKVDNVSVVARTQNNPYLNRLVENIRAKYGNNVIYKKGALKGMLSELKKNRGIGILMDQAVLKDEGYVIDFLGRPAWTTKMPALMARKTGAAVVPIFINRNGDKHIINIYPEVNLSIEDDTEKAIIEDTERFSGYIENYIKEHPTEWLWTHKRWKRAQI